ncbi:membrane protein [Patiriisocius marinistellae]|uniref:Membrane protein n=1 Tax=Patiriisocius marinistellae TaxID=2494560 RepID=A0A5J4G137_9FLAO|nr:DUF1361 domain-containing protein [Patiriisocius marinistellae]GEQ87294.1 membrane protein [Patiriisocius marinistellae]
MEKIKSVVIENFTILFYAVLLLGTSLFLLMLRMKITHSFFLLFLVWNLFLAWIPYGISSALLYRKGLSKSVKILGFGAWLLFLPNAPYIVTDLVHLQRSEDVILWLDSMVIGSFAISGLYGYICSVMQIQMFLQRHISEKRTSVIIFCTHFLCGFGIYLGRFLRFNSWDLLQNPINLFKSIIISITNPIALITTIGSGVLLWVMFKGYKNAQS